MNTIYTYDFDHLATAEKIEILMASPLVHQAAALLPEQGMTTKPAATDRVGTLVLAMATVLWGRDARSDNEVRYAWSRLAKVAADNGIPMPSDPLRVSHFTDYRRRFCTPAVVSAFGRALEDQARSVAIDLGLFPLGSIDLLNPNATNVIVADGYWVAEASSVGRTVYDLHLGKAVVHPSRSKTGNPRLAEFDDVGRTHGYCFIDYQVRGLAKRLIVCLGVEPAPMGDELTTVMAGVKRHRQALGERFGVFVYDGAFSGKHHIEVRELGVLSVTKPKGTKSLSQWEKLRNTPTTNLNKVIDWTFDTGCTAQLEVAAGLMWQLTKDMQSRFVRTRVLDRTAVRIVAAGDRERWEVDLVVRCEQCGQHHTLTVDPNVKMATRKGTVNLPEQFRILPANGGDAMRTIYGLRNNSEAFHRQLKTDTNYGDRAGSLARHHVELDMLLFMLAKNALAWAEHGGTILARQNYSL